MNVFACLPSHFTSTMALEKYRPGPHIPLFQSRNRLRASKGGPQTPAATRQRGCPVSLLHHCDLDSNGFSSPILFILLISQLIPKKLKCLIFSSRKKSEKAWFSYVNIVTKKKDGLPYPCNACLENCHECTASSPSGKETEKEKMVK